ncbi:MAG: hypothetical protein JW715_04375 [Sedimentisphaerales bacterium]|nr:hypothetical protein [Sedimentisphaerales bacterium]
MSKLLVVDKCSFQGIPLLQLIEFVENYYIVFPYALCVECLMCDNKNTSNRSSGPQLLLKQLNDSIKAGANVGHSSASLLRMEKELLAAADSIVDEESTLKAKEGMINLDKNFIASEAEICRTTFEPLINLLYEFATTFFKNVEKKNLCNEFRDDHLSTDVERFKKWLQVADEMKAPLVQHMFSEEISSTIQDDWFTWQITRLWWVWVIDWACKRNYSGPSFENRYISNDLYDMEYIAYLSRADGILTQDERLVKPLAKAVFPDKDVFFSIEEVPDSYLCHWN